MTTALAHVDRQEIVEDAPIEQIITEEFISKLEKASELYQNRYLPICFKLTNEADWVNHGKHDKPKFSLQASGAEKLCTPLGIVWDRPAVIKHERSDDLGAYYEYEIEGIVKCGVLRRWGWFTGNCSSRDQFFTARGRFDEGDIRKAAFSNWIVNAVTRMAGIRNPSMELLKKAGLNPEKVESIDYSGRRTPEQDATLISEAQRKRLWAIAKSKGVGEDAVKQKFGLASFNEIKRGDYDHIVKWVEDGAKPESPAAPAGGESEIKRDGSPEGQSPGDGKTPAGDFSPTPGEPTPTEKLLIRIQEHLDSGKLTKSKLTAYCHANICHGSHKEGIYCEDVKKLDLLGLQAVSAWLTLL